LTAVLLPHVSHQQNEEDEAKNKNANFEAEKESFEMFHSDSISFTGKMI
jgi:hypothetical protein